MLIKVKIKPSSTGSDENMVSYTNTRLLIMLSASELTTSVVLVIDKTKVLVEQRGVFSIITIIFLVSAGFSLSVIYSITLNRLISTVYPLWYRNTMTKEKFIGAAALGCFVTAGLLFSMGIVYWKFFVHGEKLWLPAMIIGFALYSLYFVFCVITYSLIFLSIVKSKRNLQANDDDDASLTTF